MSNNLEHHESNFALSKSIVLVGLMGAGKSSIGKKLAEDLSLPFYDSDELIEAKTKNSIEDIYNYWGEDVFRDCETNVIKKLLLEEPIHVLATGDGAFMFNEDLISKNSLTIWINARLDLIYNRINNRTNNPQLLYGDDKFSTLKKLYMERKPFYSKAHIIVPSYDEPYKITVARIMESIEMYLSTGMSSHEYDDFNDDVEIEEKKDEAKEEKNEPGQEVV